MGKFLHFLENMKGFEEQKILQITTDKNQFERNVRAEYKCNFLFFKIEYIKQHLSYIGKEVFKHVNSFSYIPSSDLENIDNFELKMNPIQKISVVFTEELFDEFVLEYIKYQINQLIKELTEYAITKNSTCKLTNLTFEWQLECKQELLIELKDLLFNNK